MPPSVVRVLVMVAGAAAIAFIASDAGMSLPGGLCVFLLAVPVLWVVGWMTGATFIGRRARHLGRKVATDLDLRGRVERADAQARVEQVRLEIAELGLEVTVRSGESTHRMLYGWQRVGLVRPQADLLYVQCENEMFQLPRSAFSDAAAFEAWAHALQAALWRSLK